MLQYNLLRDINLGYAGFFSLQNEYLYSRKRY